MVMIHCVFLQTETKQTEFEYPKYIRLKRMNSVCKYRLDKGRLTYVRDHYKDASSEVGHHVAMVQKALVLSKLHVFCLLSHQQNRTIQILFQVQTLVGLVENKIDNKIKLNITE